MGTSLHTKSLLLSSPSKSLTTTPALNHKKSFKNPKEKRRSSSKSDQGGATQWYTTEETTPNGTPIFELTEEVCTYIKHYFFNQV